MAAGVELDAESLEPFRRRAGAPRGAASSAPQDLIPGDRVDAVVPAERSDSELAEELERLRALRLRQPAAHPARARRAAGGRVRHGRGAPARALHARHGGGSRSRGVAFGSAPALTGRGGRRAARRSWSGSSATAGTAWWSRGWCCGRCASPRPGRLRVLGEDEPFWERVEARCWCSPTTTGSAPRDGMPGAAINDATRRGDGLRRPRPWTGAAAASPVVGELLTSGSGCSWAWPTCPAGAESLEQLVARPRSPTGSPWSHGARSPSGRRWRSGFQHLVALDPPPAGGPADPLLGCAPAARAPRLGRARGRSSRWRAGRARPAATAGRALPRASRGRGVPSGDEPAAGGPGAPARRPGPPTRSCEQASLVRRRAELMRDGLSSARPPTCAARSGSPPSGATWRRVAPPAAAAWTRSAGPLAGKGFSSALRTTLLSSVPVASVQLVADTQGGVMTRDAWWSGGRIPAACSHRCDRLALARARWRRATARAARGPEGARPALRACRPGRFEAGARGATAGRRRRVARLRPPAAGLNSGRITAPAAGSARSAWRPAPRPRSGSPARAAKARRRQAAGRPRATWSAHAVDAARRGRARRAAATASSRRTERALLGDLLAVIEEHSSDVGPGDRTATRWSARSCSPASTTRTSGGARGEDFIIHPVGVAKICAGMRLDTETLCAALLHDTVEDTSASLDEVRGRVRRGDRARSSTA